MFRKQQTPRSVRTLDSFRVDAIEAERGLHKASARTLSVFDTMLDGAMAHGKGLHL